MNDVITGTSRDVRRFISIFKLAFMKAREVNGPIIAMMFYIVVRRAIVKVASLFSVSSPHVKIQFLISTRARKSWRQLGHSDAWRYIK